MWFETCVKLFLLNWSIAIINICVSSRCKNTGNICSYALDILSCGVNGTTDLSTAGEVTFNWDDNSAEGNANADDKAMLLVYNPDKKESIYVLDGANRTTGSDVLSIPGSYAGDTVHLFMAFVTSDNSTVSNSIYLGSGTAI